MMGFKMSDPRWGNMGIGTAMRTYGCLVTSLSMLIGKAPDNVLNALMVHDCFTDTSELIWAKAASILGFKRYQYLPANTPITRPIICETHDNAPKFPKHFFIGLPGGQIIDPLDGKTQKNKYKIVSQRLLA